MGKKTIRMSMDIGMALLLPVLMAYSLIGEVFHEVIGSLMLFLFIGHGLLNRRWYQSVFRGKYLPRRIFQTIVNGLLLIIMALQPLSGILMSKHLYTFIQISGVTASARAVHLFHAYWGLVLMNVHAGTHMMPLLAKMKKRKFPKTVILILAAVSLYGCMAFFKRQIPDYMFGRSSFVFFDYSEPRLFFFMDYLSVMILFALAGFLIVTVLEHFTKYPKSLERE